MRQLIKKIIIPHSPKNIKKCKINISYTLHLLNYHIYLACEFMRYFLR